MRICGLNVAEVDQLINRTRRLFQRVAKKFPDALLADKAYDTDAIQADLKERRIKPVIPPKSNRTATIRYSKRLYRERNCIERVLGHLKINRAIATRYDQLAESFLGMLFIASARYWIKFVHAA